MSVRLTGQGAGPARRYIQIAFLCFVVGICCSSCGGGDTIQATKLDPSALNRADVEKDYVIGPLDKLSIRVFQVQELSQNGLQVDMSGQIVLPLIGSIKAAGKTTDALARDIADRLGQRYLQSPQVSVSVEESAGQKVTVEGEVKTAGVFKMSGETTLMEALAMAGGPSDEADLHQVAIIRVVNGTKKAAICDYTAIRDGGAPDPVIQGGDVVVMNGSGMKTAWNDLLKSIPLLALIAIGS